MAPHFGAESVCIGVQIRGPYYRGAHGSFDHGSHELRPALKALASTLRAHRKTLRMISLDFRG